MCRTLRNLEELKFLSLGGLGLRVLKFGVKELLVSVLTASPFAVYSLDGVGDLMGQLGLVTKSNMDVLSTFLGIA